MRIKRQVSTPRIVMAALKGGMTWRSPDGTWRWVLRSALTVAVAVSPGMSGEGHAWAQTWVDANLTIRAQQVVDVRKAVAARAVLTDATFRQRWIDDAHKRAEERALRDGAPGWAMMLADSAKEARRPAPTVRVCDCAQCMAVAEARRIELWKPILHAEAHLRAKSSMHAYNSALSMVN